jgi:hypothetical protein
MKEKTILATHSEVALGLSSRISAVSKTSTISTRQKRNQVHPKDPSQKLSTTLHGAQTGQRLDYSTETREHLKTQTLKQSRP